MLPELAEIAAVRVQHRGKLVVDRVDVVVEVEIRLADRARRIAEARAEHPVEQAVERRLRKPLLQRQGWAAIRAAGEIFMRSSIVLLSAGLTLLSAGTALAQNATPHNLILFVPDGLRALKVTPETAPAMAEIRDKGVNFKNPHSLFPTFTMANASGMATGHFLGDTGTFSNTIFTGYVSKPAGDTVVPFIENDAVIGDIDEHFGGNYLNEETILKLARAQGFSTAAIGKVGPTLVFDHTDRADRPDAHSIVINGPTPFAAIKNVHNNRAQLHKTLDDLGLSANTDVMISADHGFSTISKESKTSPAKTAAYSGTPKDFLPMGFVAIYLAKALG